MTRTLACRGASRRGSVQRRLRGTTAGAPADGDPPPRGQGGRLGARALRRRLLQAAQLDEPALQRRPRTSTTTASARGPSSTRRTSAWSSRSRRSCTTAGTTSASTPGLSKDGVEAHLQELLAAQVETFGPGWRLVRREFPTPIGPVDLLCRDADGASVAVEIKRRGDIDGVEQLTRYLELLNRDPLLAPVRGIFAAQEIKPQARVLAADRGIACVTVDYDALRGFDDPTTRLF